MPKFPIFSGVDGGDAEGPDFSDGGGSITSHEAAVVLVEEGVDVHLDQLAAKPL